MTARPSDVVNERDRAVRPDPGLAAAVPVVDLVDRSHVHDNIEASIATHQTFHPSAPPG